MLDPGPLSFTYTNLNVGAASTLLIAANSKRYYLAIFNRSTEQVDVTENAPAVLGAGTPIAPTASTGALPSFHEWSTHRGNLTQQPLYGICTSGGMAITIKEGF